MLTLGDIGRYEDADGRQLEAALEYDPARKSEISRLWLNRHSCDTLPKKEQNGR